MRKTFRTKKKLSEMGLEPGPKWAKFIFSNFLLHKNLDKNFEKTSMKWISYQISTSYNELYLINSGISGREREKERERERDKLCVINVKYKEIP